MDKDKVLAGFLKLLQEGNEILEFDYATEVEPKRVAKYVDLKGEPMPETEYHFVPGKRIFSLKIKMREK